MRAAVVAKSAMSSLPHADAYAHAKEFDVKAAVSPRTRFCRSTNTRRVIARTSAPQSPSEPWEIPQSVISGQFLTFGAAIIRCCSAYAPCSHAVKRNPTGIGGVKARSKAHRQSEANYSQGSQAMSFKTIARLRPERQPKETTLPARSGPSLRRVAVQCVASRGGAKLLVALNPRAASVNSPSSARFACRRWRRKNPALQLRGGAFF